MPSCLWRPVAQREGGDDESDAADDELAGDDPEEGDDGAVTAVSEVAAVSAAVPGDSHRLQTAFLAGITRRTIPRHSPLPCLFGRLQGSC